MTGLEETDALEIGKIKSVLEAANLEAWSAHDTDAGGRDEGPCADGPCDTIPRQPDVAPESYRDGELRTCG